MWFYTVYQQIVRFLFPPTRAVVRIMRAHEDACTSLATQQALQRTCVPCIAFLPFENALVRDAIHALKYYRCERASLLLVRAVAPLFAEELADKRLFGTCSEPLFLPIPLHPQKLHQRGFNQSAHIAQTLLAELEDPHITLSLTALVRIHTSLSQTKTKDAKERLAHVQGAFLAQRKEVQGRDIILIDDVVTTGATLKSASDALKKAGARVVWCIAIAH